MKKAYVHYGAPASITIYLLGVPEKERKKRAESLFKGMVDENFANQGRNRDI